MSVVLIAEDEEAILEIFVELVEGMGHQPLRAHDGEEALALARLHRPHVVVSDYMMPRRNGLELLRALRADEQLSVVPFVLVSAARPRGHEAATRFLAKPVELDAFERTMEEMLAASRAREGTADQTRPAVAEARKVAPEREEMLNWVAHEFKTPLGTARLNSQVLLRKLAGEENAAARRAAESIVRQLDRLNVLVSSILDAASLDDGRVQLARERADLCALLRTVVHDWQEQAPQVEFVLQCPADPVLLAFDQERLRTVLDNLLSNAVKYGGEARRVELSLALHPGQAVVQVRDWGVGIAAAELPRVFERFHRADTEKGRGHGLGLYIAAALARLHGGSLGVESTLGRGSTFSLKLPV